MSKTSLSAKFFRARIYENGKLYIVWDFGNFAKFTEFYTKVGDIKESRGNYRIDFLFCYASDTKEHLLDSFTIQGAIDAILSYPHPHRQIRSGQYITKDKPNLQIDLYEN